MARLANLPLHDFAENQIWCALVARACELPARMRMVAPTGSTPDGANPTRGTGRRTTSLAPIGAPDSLGHYFAGTATFRNRNPERPRRIPSEASTTAAKA